jgi:hypothetical protein
LLKWGKSEIIFDLTQKLLLYSLPVLAVAGIAVPLALGKYNFSLLGSYLAIPMFLSSAVYIKYRKNFSECRELGDNLFLLSTNLYLLNFIASLVLIQAFKVRPFAYYVLITFMITLILFNIFFFEIDRKRSILLLFLIMLLVLNIIWGVNLNYYFFIGRTDSIGHAWLIEKLMAQGRITDLFGIYKPFPLWHILVSSLYSVTGVHISAHRVMFFTSGIIYSFMVPIIYLISLKILKDIKLALLSSLFMIIYSDIIFYGMYSISRSVVPFLEVLLILLLLNRGRPERAILYIIIIYSMIMFHTASMPFIIIIFFIIWMLQKLLGIEGKDLFLTNYCMMLMVVTTLFYWMFFAEGLFRIIILNIFGSAPSGIMTKSIVNMPLNELANYLHYSPILFFTLFGILFAIKSDKILNNEKIFFLTGLLMIPLTFPGPSLLINKLSNNFNLARFVEYSFVFILIASALGFGILFYKSKKYTRLLLILIFIIMSFLSVSNDFIATDNPLVKRPFYTYYLTDEEITCFSHVSNLSKGYLMSDYVTASFISRYMRNSTGQPTKEHILEADGENMTLLRNSSEDLVLIRRMELSRRPLSLFTTKDGSFELDPNIGNSCDYYSRDLPLWNTLDSYNEVFESNQIAGYI